MHLEDPFPPLAGGQSGNENERVTMIARGLCASAEHGAFLFGFCRIYDLIESQGEGLEAVERVFTPAGQAMSEDGQREVVTPEVMDGNDPWQK